MISTRPAPVTTIRADARLRRLWPQPSAYPETPVVLLTQLKSAFLGLLVAGVGVDADGAGDGAGGLGGVERLPGKERHVAVGADGRATGLAGSSRPAAGNEQSGGGERGDGGGAMSERHKQIRCPTSVGWSSAGQPTRYLGIFIRCDGGHSSRRRVAALLLAGAARMRTPRPVAQLTTTGGSR